ncbi:efflux RND transporter periplasmic adaptor subunit [Thalassotalea sp. Y01]|uniref:efflux RND transporter periplasmic adaptor subunit n=1 Tax=Thalassotalea sp. Y01 TaxID=2729613 RepID=UPI00145E2635|nr:efflux RND transporter periplasmic adaptor subunit [Thalassotalea sp. Y01]NMP15340.1 HlyD family efflux transporter periplasmic adaptor subunit [Thalassotalea sp. Y01]
MKEIMIPYVLLMWILISTGAIKWTLRNAFWIVSVGAFILALLFYMSRLWAPVDMTNSSTIKAPHSVVSPLIGEQINEIHVDHNQIVKKGDVIYTLVDTESESEVAAIEAEIVKQQESVKQMTRDIQRSEEQPEIFNQRAIEKAKSDKRIALAQLESLQADLDKASFEQELKTVKAPFDGQVAIVNIANGSRIGNMKLYDISRKFMEIRVPDQTFRYVKKGQFAEFYVDAYPGEVFRARVHSFNAGTGEAAVSPINQQQSVKQHVGKNSTAHGRTVVLEIFEPEGKTIPIGATGSAWICATKPHPFFGFIDVIGAATVRLHSYKSYLNTL